MKNLEVANSREISASPSRQFKYLDFFIYVFVVVLLVSNIVGPKITAIGPFRISGAQLLFPITYIFGDIFTEVYGYAASRRAIWAGFFASALLSVMGLFAVWLPPAPGWEGQEAFAQVLGFVPRMVAASLIAYWFGEFTNAFVMSRMKVLTGGRYLWMRTIGSTAIGQLVDTALVMTLAFGGTVRVSLLLNLILSGYLGKVLYEAAATPVTYAVVNFLKRKEGVDVYDYATNYNPFEGNIIRET